MSLYSAYYKKSGSVLEASLATDNTAEIVNPTAMKNYLSISNGRLDRSVDETLRHSRPLTTSSENNISRVSGSNGHLFYNGNSVNLNPAPTKRPENLETPVFQISGSTDRLSVNSFTTTTTIPAGHNLR